MSKKFNFYAGPAILPQDVMKKAQMELLDLNGIGLSVLEISHRSKEFSEIIETAESKLRNLLNVPADYSILFLQGGASLQFGMIPMNLLRGGQADYVHTGSWAAKAIKEAKLFGTVNIAGSSEDKNFSYVPEAPQFSPEAAYVHLTSNETIGGIQYASFPDTGKVPLIVDMSSDILSRKIDVSQFGLIYAGAQKNMGPAGVTLAIIRKDLLEIADDNLTTMLRYKTHVEKSSLYNTPPAFAIYMVKLVLDWIDDQGGLASIESMNEQKASLLYQTIDASSMYRGTAAAKDRSKMNVTFRLSSEDLEAKFVTEATAAGLVGLKGHRSVGGCRASIYNAMPLEGIQALVGFMKEFEIRNS